MRCPTMISLRQAMSASAQGGTVCLRILHTHLILLTHPIYRTRDALAKALACSRLIHGDDFGA